MYLILTKNSIFKCEELPTDGHGKSIKVIHKIKLKEFEEKWSINDLKWQYKDEIKEVERNGI